MGAFAVGAVQWGSDTIASYSNQGPLPNGIFKPEISAPTGISSLAYAEEGEYSFNGTSAACPEAAGLAALIKSANLKLSSSDLAQVILQSVKDLGASGPDTVYGYGRSDLTGVKPGDTSLKSNRPNPPALNLNPDLNIKTSSRFPAPSSTKAVTPTARPNATPTKAATPTARPSVTRATAVPSATAIPDMTSVPSSSVTFRDDFQLIGSGLPNRGATVYEKGTYKIKANVNQLVWATYPDSVQVQDFVAEVKVQGINDNSGIYGLVFWSQSPTNYYLLSVTGVGLLQVSQFNAGQWKELVAWTAAPGWNKGGLNTVRLVAAGNQLSVGVNNKQAKTVQASGSGGIGFAAAGYNQAVNATFNDFRLTTRG
jgi:hypothetical protein